MNVERIVREVVARLGIAKEYPQRDAAHSRGLGELLVQSSVVSLSQLDGKLDGVCRVRVPAGAVVTPAARERLKDAQVELAFAPRGTAAAATTRWTVGATLPCENALAMLPGDIPMDIRRSDRLVPLLEQLSASIETRGALGLLITGETAAAVCLANRQPHVRAAVACDASSVAAAVRAIDVNLLVVDPRGRSRIDWARMIEAYGRPLPGGVATYENELAAIESPRPKGPCKCESHE
jgi:hypothetical protein